ncbi:MAG: ABC transporter ATP-binding protein [Mameliella sp.]|nr:ABC transporter ATP-binding protein [Mameliella sp.]
MHGKDVHLESVSITFPNGITAVQPTDMSIEAGEFFSILGPSGCGKTTILRTIAGLVAPGAGRVLIGGEDMGRQSPGDRPTAVIFQTLALFPGMSLRDNVAFGLEARGMPRRKRRARAEDLLHLMGLDDKADKKPAELSGSQPLRVAIARALAVEPAVMLLDEPLSGLDRTLRRDMRAELRETQKRTGITFIYATRDPGDALVMSDRISVMNRGRIEQVGSSDAIYSNPKTAFAASFVGEANRLPGRVTDAAAGLATIETGLGRFRARNPSQLDAGARGILFVRPEAMELNRNDNAVSADLVRRDLEGPFVTLHFQAGGQCLSVCQSTPGETALPMGGSASLGFDPTAALILPAGELFDAGHGIAAE